MNFYVRESAVSRQLRQKLLRIMKLTVLLLTVALVQVSAKGISQNVSYSGNHVSLKQLFEVIEKQTGYVVGYNEAVLAGTKLVNVNARNLSLLAFLDQILKDQPLNYIIKSKSIVISRDNQAAFLPGGSFDAAAFLAPPADITGRVVDSVGGPVPGIYVIVKGTRNATTTGDNGEFRLKGVAPEAVLQVSGVNIELQELAVNGRTDITIRAVIKVGLLSELTLSTVSNGYQTISKERSTGAYAKADMNIVADRSGSMNILQRLDGLMPGLVVNPAPNRTPYQVRGLTTIGAPTSNGLGFSGTNPSPLFVVDGIPLDADQVGSINPQDVRDVTLLKDATAASIWGARAANGVIVIVTKKGTTNSKLKVNYDGFMNIQGRPDFDYMPMLSSKQYIDVSKSIFNSPGGTYLAAYPWQTVSTYVNSGSVGVPPHELIQYNLSRGLITQAQADKSLDSLSALDNHGQISDLLYRSASLMNHTLSLSGGGNMHSFYGSLAYTDTKSTAPGEKNTSYKINLRQDFKVTPGINIFLITDLTQTNTGAKNNLTSDYTFYPYQLFRDGNGKNISMPYLKAVSDSTRLAFEARSRINLDYNPLDDYNYVTTKGDNMLARVTGGASIKLYKGLRFEGTYGYVKGSTKTTTLEDLNSYAVRSEIVSFTVSPTATSTPTYYLPTNGGRYTVRNSNIRNWTVRNQLVYDNRWDKHEITALAGQEAQEQLATGTASRVRGYNGSLLTQGSVNYTQLASGIAGTIFQNSNGGSVLGNDAFSSTETSSRFLSYYGNLAYTYNRKYAINGSIRTDQSTLFGKDKGAQGKPLWSAGAKWIMTNEDFMRSLSWIDLLAVRATYGYTGNSPNPGVAASFDIVSPSNNGFFPGGTGLGISTPGNAKLTWESTQTINFGLDIAVLKGRLNAVIDLYRKKTSNMLGALPLNSLTGYGGNVVGNIGDMTNKGIEVMLNSQNIRTKDFSWNSSLVLAYNKNYIDKVVTFVKYTTGAQMTTAAIVQDYPAYAVFAYDFAKLDALGDPMIYLKDKSMTKALNIAKPEDMVFMGTYQPVWNGGFSNQFRYKNFSLFANMVYSLGHVMRRERQLMFNGQLRRNISTDFLNRWQQPGDEDKTDIPSYVPNPSTAGARRNTDYFTYGDNNVVSASYIKIRDITLSYDLPKSITSKLRAERIAFRAQLSNLMVWTANKDKIDPEFIGSVPINQRAITLGAHVSF
jgi:TonB-linked SusC/RagA family outer membrane protein